MKVLRICSFALLLVLGLFLMAGSTTVAQDTNPATIYQAAYDAFNAGDIDSGMTLGQRKVITIRPGYQPSQSEA